MREVEIRNACLDDSPAIACLISQLGYPTSPTEMKERLATILIDPNYRTFVAEHQKEVIGVIGVGVGRFYEKNGTYGRLLALAVDEKWRSQGIGASLVAEAECWLKECKATSIVVNSGKQRSATHRFYKRLGYEETGLRLVKLLL